MWMYPKITTNPSLPINFIFGGWRNLFWVVPIWFVMCYTGYDNHNLSNKIFYFNRWIRSIAFCAAGAWYWASCSSFAFVSKSYSWQRLFGDNKARRFCKFGFCSFFQLYWTWTIEHISGIWICCFDYINCIADIKKKFHIIIWTIHMECQIALSQCRGSIRIS